MLLSTHHVLILRIVCCVIDRISGSLIFPSQWAQAACWGVRYCLEGRPPIDAVDRAAMRVRMIEDSLFSSLNYWQLLAIESCLCMRLGIYVRAMEDRLRSLLHAAII